MQIPARMLFCILMVVIPAIRLSAQPTPTVIPDNFNSYDLFEFQLESEWKYLSDTAQIPSSIALSRPFEESQKGGWWMLMLLNKSSIEDFSIRFGLTNQILETYIDWGDGEPKREFIGAEIINPHDRILDRLNATSFSIPSGSMVKLLVRDSSVGMKNPAGTLNSTSKLQSYSWSHEKLSMIFSIVFLFILIYQLGTMALIQSRSYAYYSLLAFGYLLHAFNYQLDGLTTVSFADDVSIISATLICVAGLLLWKRYLKVNEGIWFRLFQIMAAIGFSIILLVSSYLIFSSVVPRYHDLATMSAALLAVSVITVWIVSAIVMSFQGRENARYYLITNVPILLGGIFFITIWLSIRYEWIAFDSSLTIITNYIFFGSAVGQLLLFSLVIGLTLKKRLTKSYRNEKSQKVFFEDRVKERTSELEEINSELGKKNQELERINDTKNRLLAILSHDFRAPINNVASLMALLKEHRFSPEEFSSLLPELEKSISDTTNFMSLLISWTQSQSEGLVPNKSVFRVEDLLSRSVEHFRTSIDNKNLRLETVTNDLEICADRNMLDLVLRNLLSNAIKFSQSNETIKINCTEERDRLVKIDVIDQGVGIDKSRNATFFDVSKKNTTSGTQGEKGFGMGLILCRDFIELNDGKLSFTSEKGKGSTFSLLIPSCESVGISSPLVT